MENAVPSPPSTMRAATSGQSTGTPLPSEALLCVYYPQQLLPGLAAIIELRQHLNQESTAPATVFVWSDPGVGNHFLRLRQQAFEQLLAPFPWVKLVFPPPQDIKRNLSPNFRVRAKARHLRKRFGSDAFGAVHYAHDIGSDFLAQSAMQAFPRAVRACFGDALGVVYSNDYYTQQTYPTGTAMAWLKSPRTQLMHWAWRCKRAYTLPPRRDQLDADYVVPVLLCDPGGDFVPGKAVLNVRRETLDHVVEGLIRGAGAQPDTDFTDKHLLLLGSFSETGLTGEDDECALYVHAARAHVPAGQTVLLKAHPASYGGKVRKIAQALQAHYTVELTDADAMPIETLRHLARCRTVLSFSYSSVSLHYLHGSHVVHAMNDALIQRYFPPSAQPWVHESNVLYLEQLDHATRLRSQQMAAKQGRMP